MSLRLLVRVEARKRHEARARSAGGARHLQSCIVQLPVMRRNDDEPFVCCARNGRRHHQTSVLRRFDERDHGSLAPFDPPRQKHRRHGRA